MTTALQQLLAELDAAPAGCLDDVRRWVRTLAMEMMQMQQPVSVPTVIATASSCRDNGEGICTSCNTVHTMPDYSLTWVDPWSRDDTIAMLRRDVAKWRDHAKEVESERDAARAEVERLTAIADGRERQLEKMAAQRDAFIAESTKMREQRDVFRAELANVRAVVERETVSAIAKWLDKRARQMDPESFANPSHVEQHAVALDNAVAALQIGAWRTK